MSLLLGLCGLTFAPSFELTKTEFISAENLEINSTVPAGWLIILPLNSSTPLFHINGVPFTEIPQRDLQYGVASVYGGPLKILRAQSFSELAAFSGVFHSPVSTVLEKKIWVKKDQLNTGNELRLPSSVMKKLKSAEEEKKQQDSRLLASALKGDVMDFDPSCLKLPVENKKITSAFGRPRTLPSGRSYYHSGVDLRAWEGTPILNTKPGQVVFAGHMIVPGNNVIVSHGGGLFSRYLHLSEIHVQTGQRLPAQAVVGLSGATGRVEASHLHWEMIWKGQFADPLLLLREWEQICDPK